MLPVVRCALDVDRCAMRVARYMALRCVRWLWFAVCCLMLLFVIGVCDCSLFVVCCCFVVAVCCVLCVVCCLLIVVRRVLLVARWLLRADCCALHGG